MRLETYEINMREGDAQTGMSERMCVHRFLIAMLGADTKDSTATRGKVKGPTLYCFSDLNSQLITQKTL